MVGDGISSLTFGKFEQDTNFSGGGAVVVVEEEEVEVGLVVAVGVVY